MDIVNAEHFMQDQIPEQYLPHIPTALKSAYAAVKVLVAEEPILQVESAMDNRGRLISWATDLAVKKLIDTGQWPFDYRWKSFSRPTGRYLEVRLSHSVMSISQIKDPADQPRNVGFRENGRLNNQPFLDFPDLKEEQAVLGLPHFLLLHGYRELEFAHIALPHKEHVRGHICRTTNLMRMPHEVPLTLAPTENTDYEATMTLKEEIEKWRRDNGA